MLKYNTLLHERLTTTNVFSHVKQLTAAITSPRLNKAHQAEYEALDNSIIKAKWFAEQHCRKIKAGNIPWCPQISHCINRILYWKGLLSKIQGSRISSSVLNTRAKKAGIVHSQASLAIPTETLQSNITAAYRSFNCIKKEPLRRDTWIANLIAAQAEHSNQSKKLIWKQLRLTEQARNTARAV